MAEFRRSLSGVLALALPLPFELQSVNVYLVALGEGYLLVDCGMNTEPAFETLGAQWKNAAWPGPNIADLLTHMHPDHMGMAARLLD